MTAEHWQRVEAIVQSALDIESGAERIRFISDACAGDEELRREVERLMIAADDADSFIESPAWTGSGLLDSVAKKEIRDSLDEQIENDGSFDETDNFIGRRIGVFELKKELGRGGMGAVFLAERADGEFRQKAAVKLIKRGMDTDFIVKRFRHERQILAALNHPNIARLIDGGTTADGLPYFVMEYVEGEPLYCFCDERKLNTAERLRLFKRLCEAVEAAHELRVVHRDLKPSNILVKANGTPKLLDFGIAKILDSDLASATLEPTATAMRLMTPEYASPEQVCGEPVSPASDIYSLGVLLYELLTGHRPYRFKNRALHEIHRAVCEEIPSVPSESLTREDNLVPTGASGKSTSDDEKIAAGKAASETTLEIVFRARNTDFENLRRELAGDLDKIVLKTLRKNAAERYQTASELAADIGRFLEKRPVKAEAFGAIEKSEKAAVKSKRGESNFAGKQSAAILPFKIIGAANTKDTDGEEFLGVGLADALITRLSVIRQIVVRPTSSILAFAESTDPFRAGHELAVDFVVDGNIRRSGERIRVTVHLLSVPDNATLWAQTFDEKFTDVLELEDSISERVAKSLLPQLTGEEQIQLNKRGTNSSAAYEAYLRGRFHWNQFTPESLAKALESFKTAIEIDPNYALPYVGVADFYSWANIYGLIPSLPAHEEAERAARRAIEIDPDLGEAYTSLGLTLHNRMRWAEAEKVKLEALRLNPNYPYAHEQWAGHLIGTGREDEGVKALRRGESLDPLGLRTKTLNAWMLYQAHRFDDALAVAQQIVELDKNYPQGYSQAGFAFWAMKRCDEALANFQKFDEMIPDFALAKYQLCFGLAAVNRHPEARAVLDEMKTLAANGYVKPFFLAMAHVAVGETDAAFDYFEQSFDEQEPWLMWFGTDPMLEILHDDARFVRLLERMNNPIAAKFKARRAAKNQPKTFAVLPFKLLQFNTGDDSEDQFLSIGLTDALITRLSKFRRVVVRPTSAVVRFCDNSDAFQAGKELETDFVLAGNIRRAGNRVRVSAQLLSVADKSTAWAETFDEKFTDVLELEDSIAERVAKSLLPQLTGEEQIQLQKRETNLPEAYEAYLRGRFYWSLMTEEGFSKAIGFYERAVALDPNYALAYAAIAEYYIFLAIHCVIPFSEASRRTKDAAERAAAIDPQLSEAQAALGIAALNHDFDWNTAEKHLRRAIEISPNSILAHSWYHTLLLESGRFDEMRVVLDRVLELNPEGLLSLHYLAWSHFHTRRFDESIAVHRRMLKNEPNYAWGHFTFSWLLRRIGEFAEALTEAKKGVELAANNPMYLTALAAAFAENGQRAEALETLDAINETAATRYVSPYMLAIVYCSLGEREQAFELLEKALDERDVWVVWLYADPQFDPLRNDARFANLLRRMNHPLAG